MADNGERWSILQPMGYNASTCGYCSEPGKRSSTKSSRSYGIWAHQLSPRIYKLLIERGWRRSGSYLYKPDLSPGRSCCPAYTIRCDVEQFKASKGQRQVVNRFVRFVKGGSPLEGVAGKGYGGASVESANEARASGMSSMNIEFPAPRAEQPTLQTTVHSRNDATRQASVTQLPRPKSKGVPNKVFDLVSAFDEAQTWKEGDKHRFEIAYEPAAFTEEKFALYKKYQIRVHNDPPSEVTSRSFDRFLCKNPFPPSAPFRSPSSSSSAPTLPSLPSGGVHARYILDSRLIAFAVLDVLPDCLSSVYFVWDPDWSSLGLGKIGALREVAMGREYGMRWYCMGFYIHSCVKMRYKGEYSASSLLDANTYEWFPLETCKLLLDAGKHASFSSPPNSQTPIKDANDAKLETTGTQDDGRGSTTSSSDEEDAEDIALPRDPLPAGFLDPDALPQDLLRQALVLDPREGIAPLLASSTWEDVTKRREAREGLAALGSEVGRQILVYLV